MKGELEEGEKTELCRLQREVEWEVTVQTTHPWSNFLWKEPLEFTHLSKSPFSLIVEVPLNDSPNVQEGDLSPPPQFAAIHISSNFCFPPCVVFYLVSIACEGGQNDWQNVQMYPSITHFSCKLTSPFVCLAAPPVQFPSDFLTLSAGDIKNS